MIKLLVLDKDGTLVRPKSGNTFVQYPEDQELIEGVAEAVQRYVADGWTIAIASNQGGCQVTRCKAVNFPVGAYYVNADNRPLMVISKQVQDEKVLLYLSEPRSNGKDYLWFEQDSEISFQYKTIDMAIVEMQYAMKLVNIRDGLICPDMQGLECYIVLDYASPPLHRMECYNHLVGSFRKPNGGMLLAAKECCERNIGRVDRKLMVGDRPEDQSAAQAAGFDFMWAHEWIAQNS